MLDFPASGEALWRLYDATGIRPEYILPVLWHESNFVTTVINSIGCAGINQMCSGALAGIGVDAQTYASWPASAQIDHGVTAYMRPYAGQLYSGARVYQANFLPATLSSATALSDVVTASPTFVSANPSLDVNQDGQITLQDLADVVAKAAAVPQVQRAIAQTYTLRPDEVEQDPAYGTDFGGSVVSPTGLTTLQALAISLGIAAAAGLGYAYLTTTPRQRRRMLQAVLP